MAKWNRENADISFSSVLRDNDILNPYLRTPAQLAAMTGFYAPHGRLARTAVFPVMHHGSRSNWHEGVAAAIGPRMSVFSSDPERRGWRHPHFDVFRDFVDHHPIQVDRRDGWAWRGAFVFDGT